MRWSLLRPAERLAGLPEKGRLHILRHTFCSRLAARDVPMLTIKDLAGHASIETTMRYMHRSSAVDGNRPRDWRHLGDGAEGAPGGERVLPDEPLGAGPGSHDRDALDAPERDECRVPRDEQVAPTRDGRPQQGLPICGR